MEAKPKDIPLEELFVNDTNAHKYAGYWASGMYKLINYNMRNLSFLKNLTEFIESLQLSDTKFLYFQKKLEKENQINLNYR